MWGDLSHAVRRLRRAPSFAATVLATVVLGVGAAVAVFSVAYAVVLRPLPYADPHRVMVIWEQQPKRGVPVVEVSHRNFVDWRARNRSFDDLAAFGSVNWSFRLTGNGEPTVLPYAAVSGSFFSLLDVRPAVGRALATTDDRPGAEPVVVLSFGLWKGRFGGTPDIVGQSVQLSGEPYTVVGVMPRGFDFPRGAQLWATVAPRLEAVSRENKFDALEARWLGVLFVLGRLKDGVTIAAARTDIDSIVARLGAKSAGGTALLTSLVDRVYGQTRPALLLLLGAALLILLIACANISTLFLMRAARLARDTAIRLAIGATRTHLWRVWMSESLVLFLLGGAGGVLAGSLGLPALTALASESVYRIDEAGLPWQVLAFALAASLAGAILTTTVAGLAAGRLQAHECLGSGGHSVTNRRTQRSRRALVTAEMALAFVLLVVAGLTIRSFVKLRQLDLGFDPSRVLTFDVQPPEGKYPGAARNTRFYEELLDRIRLLPDVEAAGGVFLRPLRHEAIGVDAPLLREGQAPEEPAAWRANPAVNKEAVTPGYFEAMRIRVLQGRSFAKTDSASAQLVAIVSAGAAKALWPGADPLGERVLVAGNDSRDAQGSWRWRTVVGVVADVRYRGLEDVRYDFYLPAAQTPDPVGNFVVHSRGDPLRLIGHIRTEVRGFETSAVVDGMTTMEEIVHRATTPWQLNMVLFAALGCLALALSVVGVYGLVAYAVAERRHEIAIRSALGASARQLSMLGVKEGAILTLIGLPLGLAAALASSHLVKVILFGIPATDPATFFLVAGLLLAVGLLASYLPARTAARMDPAQVLRQGDH